MGRVVCQKDWVRKIEGHPKRRRFDLRGDRDLGGLGLARGTPEVCPRNTRTTRKNRRRKTRRTSDFSEEAAGDLVKIAAGAPGADVIEDFVTLAWAGGTPAWARGKHG